MYKGVDLNDIFRITVLYTAFHADFSSTYSFSGEYHNFYELVCVTEGSIGVTAGNDIYILHKGQAIIHEPMEFHRIWSENNTNPSVIIISFSANNLPDSSSKVFRLDDIDCIGKVFSLIRSGFIINEDHITGINTSAGNTYIQAIKSLELFLSELISQSPGKREFVKSASARNFSKIIRTLENNIDKNLSVADIAQKCNMSENSVKKTFSKYLGTGIINHFNKLKITAAISMLENGLTVREISETLGFQNQNYFSTVFKRITGYSPTKYKKRAASPVSHTGSVQS